MNSRPRIARGAGGAGLARRAYRRSPLRWLHKSVWAHRGLRPADVFVASYPRSGSVWLRFLVMEMLTGDASFVALRSVLPELGEHAAAPGVLPGGGRVIKTHERFRSDYRRAIHLVRDPRDVALSYFHFLQRLEKIVVRDGDDEGASFDRFIDGFLRGRVDAYGTWQTHLLSWWSAAERGESDVLRLRYEDLHADPPGCTTRIAEWLGVELGDGQARAVAERCSLENMRLREQERDASSNDPAAMRARRTGMANVRSGEAGGWRSRMTAEQRRRFEEFREGMDLMGYPRD